MNWTTTRRITLEEMHCGKCDITFAVPDYWKRNRLQDGNTWYCPNGHSRAFSDPENLRLRKRLEQMEARNTHLRDQREAAERSASAYKGQVTKLKKRTANGVCPCCGRTFAQLQRHMTTKHPDYVAEANRKTGDPL